MRRRWRWARLCATIGAALALVGPSFAGARGEVTEIVVKPGDTLEGLSRRYGVSVSQLAQVNGITNPDLIRVGQVLTISGAPADGPSPAPSATPATADAAASDVTVVTVKPGDTLWTIARAHGLSVEELARLNRLQNPDTLVVGARLTLPAASPTPAPVAAAALPSSPIAGQLDSAALKHGVDATLVRALAWHVSRWNPDAGSEDAAHGVMQLTPATQQWVQTTLLGRAPSGDPVADNIEAGVTYLRYLLDRFGDQSQAVAAYLQGPASVRSRGVSPATQERVQEVLDLAQRLSAAGTVPAADPTPAPAATPTPSPQPPATTPASARAGLQDQIEALLARQPAAVEVGLVGLNLATNERVAVSPDAVLPSASVLKLGIMVTLYQEASDGHLTWTDAVRQDLSRMISVSDNDAANRLMDLVGVDRVNAVLEDYGLRHTQLRNHFSSTRSPAQPGGNLTTAADMARLLQLLATDRLVDSRASAEMRALLSTTEDFSKLARALPPDVRIEHKSGWYPGVANDVGIIHGHRGTYVLAVMTSGSTSDEAGNQLIADLSRLVYQAWGA